jgi:hypothetical protein
MSPGEKLHIHRWAVKHNLPAMMAMIVLPLAVASDESYELIAMRRAGQLNRVLPPRPELKQWLRLYRRHRGILKSLADKFGSPLGDGRQTLQEIGKARVWSRRVGQNSTTAKEPVVGGSTTASPHGLPAWLLWIKEWCARLSGNVGDTGKQKDVDCNGPWMAMLEAIARPCADLPKEYRDCLDGQVDLLGPWGFKEGSELAAVFSSSVEVQFFVEVLLPCHVQYEMTPLALLKKARSGKLNAIERLLRLDGAMIGDAKILGWLNEGGPDVRRVRMEDVGKWGTEGVRGRFSAMQVRESFGALMSVVGERMGFRFRDGKLVKGELTAREIMELFGAVDADRGELSGRAIEVEGWDDLNLESWKKAIQRRRKSWNDGLFFGVDKTGAK